jgi:hypothetical protein
MLHFLSNARRRVSSAFAAFLDYIGSGEPFNPDDLNRLFSKQELADALYASYFVILNLQSQIENFENAENEISDAERFAVELENRRAA